MTGRLGFDFSRWHPLDHWPWEARCREFYGGWRRHLSLWRDYQAPRPGEIVRRYTLCRLGRHQPRPFWTRGRDIGGEPDGYVCWNCDAPFPDGVRHLDPADAAGWIILLLLCVAVVVLILTSPAR